MDEQSLSDELNRIIDEMLGGPRPTGLRPRGLPFDIEPPNQHSSKKEFLEEKALVQTCHDHLNAVMKALVPDEKNPEVEQARSSLSSALDKQAAASAVRSSPRYITDLIMQNVNDAGILRNSFGVIIQLEQALTERLRALAVQEKAFWSYNHRPPNHYARAIALRVARIYAREKGEKPTVGTARHGGHPSTAYTRALEEIFKLLEITTRVRTPAEWAVKNLTEDDLKKPDLASRYSALGSNTPEPWDLTIASPNGLNALFDIARKGSGS